MQNQVLIIDDDADVREILSIRLRRTGLEVITADSGEHGLALLRTNSPSCVLLDLMMPGMDGFEVLAELRACECEIPVFIVTQRDDVDAHLVRSLGAEGIVAKAQALDRNFASQLQSRLSEPTLRSDALSAAA